MRVLPNRALFRLREFVADPPTLQIRTPGPTTAELVVYGRPGSSARIERAERLASLPHAWFIETEVSLDTSFRIVGPVDTTSPQGFFRLRSP